MEAHDIECIYFDYFTSENGSWKITQYWIVVNGWKRLVFINKMSNGQILCNDGEDDHLSQNEVRFHHDKRKYRSRRVQDKSEKMREERRLSPRICRVSPVEISRLRHLPASSLKNFQQALRKDLSRKRKTVPKRCRPCVGGGTTWRTGSGTSGRTAIDAMRQNANLWLRSWPYAQYHF